MTNEYQDSRGIEVVVVNGNGVFVLMKCASHSPGNEELIRKHVSSSQFSIST